MEKRRKRELERNGRGGGIRTPDPLLPKQMRYQTALRPDCNHHTNTKASQQAGSGALAGSFAATRRQRIAIVDYRQPGARRPCSSEPPSHSRARNGSIASVISPSASRPMKHQSRQVSRRAVSRLRSSR
jgi:hypothetical protein